MSGETSSVDLVARLKRRERELEAATRVSQAVHKETTVADIATAAVTVAVELVGGRAGSILLANAAQRQLVFLVSVGDNPVTPGTSMPWDQGIAGEVLHSARPRVVRNIEQAPNHFSRIDAMTGFKTLNMFALPLMAHPDRPLGVMEVLNMGEQPEEDDLAVLTIIATLTALSIERIRLFESAKLAEVAHRLTEVGHDIKNMLMPVNVGVDLLALELKRAGRLGVAGPPGEENQEGAGAAEAVTMVKDAVHRIQDRVRLITEYVKGRSSPTAFVPCRLAELADEVVGTLRFVAHERGVSLQTTGLNTVPVMRADKERLYTALYNLVDNALAEVPAGGRIEIGARIVEEGQTVLLEVRDNGRGMAPEVRDSLFSERTRTRKHGGTGLGTKIVQDVVRAHGGRVCVQSTPGQGTTFSLWLPLRKGA